MYFLMASTLPVRHRMRNTATISAGQKTDQNSAPPQAFSTFASAAAACLAASVFVSVTVTGEALLEAPTPVTGTAFDCVVFASAF